MEPTEADDLIRRSIGHMIEQNGSDLIITAGVPPTVRMDNYLEPITQRPLGPADTALLVQILLSKRVANGQAILTVLQRNRNADFSFDWTVSGQDARIRGNAFFQRGAPGLVLRYIPTAIPDMDDLGLPKAVQALSDRPRGLVLVTGPTGSGKSTTLASMIKHINHTRGFHIVTLEDPIEYVHKNAKSVVEQREIGNDTPDFASGLRAALRQNPDVVLVGEMRDLETIGAAITMAETGHLVFATLHTKDAAETINRIIDVFPSEQQQQIRIMLAGSLAGVVSQLLVPRLQGGRVAAFEVMIANPAVRGQVREGKGSSALYQTISTSAKDGMQTMERSLAELVRHGHVSEEEALGRTERVSELRDMLRQMGVTRERAPLTASAV